MREEWGGGGFPKHPQVPKFSRKPPRIHCIVVYSQLKGTNYKQQKGRDAQGNICAGLTTKLLLSSGANMQIGGLRSFPSFSVQNFYCLQYLDMTD